MARARQEEPLQSYAFWLCDITPSARAPFVTLGPLWAGFAGVSLPTLTASVQSVAPLNSYYPRTYYNNFEVGSITLRRGVLRYDSSFYQWMMRSMRGTDRVQRNLMLLHLTSSAVVGETDPNPVGFGYVEALRGLGKAYILYDCVPTRYTPGNELDATSADIAVQELEVQPSYFTEYSSDPSLLLGI